MQIIDKITALRIREKTVTAACRTTEGLEWTSRKIGQDGELESREGIREFTATGETVQEMLAGHDIPADLSDELKGDITVAVRSSELLMRTMLFPTNDPEEIAAMVGFQVDKISPFPIDQLAMSHEILEIREDSALVLMAAARRQCIDNIGDAFEKAGIHIHRIDARILGWLGLLRDEGHLDDDKIQILIMDDGIDFSLVVIHRMMPYAFRALSSGIENADIIDNLAQEIGYTLTLLDTEHDLPAPTEIKIWSHREAPVAFRSKLELKTGMDVEWCELSILPPLSSGLVQRTLDDGNHMELIPTEWVELQKRKQLMRRFTIACASMAAVWLCFLLIFFSIYKVRDMKLNSVKKKADAIAPMAAEARDNQQKLKALQAYTDRSDSSLECLREVTRMLPVADIEFVSYNYSKGKGVTLRGTAGEDDTVYDYFKTLTDSKLFSGLKNQSVNTRTTKGVRRTVYSVTLELASEGGES
jgi:hypothetical protein